MQVHASGSRPHERFFSGQSRDVGRTPRGLLNHAICTRVGWSFPVIRLVRGAVSPHPMTALPTERRSVLGSLPTGVVLTHCSHS